MDTTFTSYLDRLANSMDGEVGFELKEKTIGELFSVLPGRIESQRAVVDGFFRENFGISSISETTSLIVPEEFSNDSLLFISAEQIPRASLRSFVEFVLVDVLNKSGYKAKLSFNGFTKDMYVDTVVKKAACSLRDLPATLSSPIVLTAQKINEIPKVYGADGSIAEGVTLDSLMFNKANIGKDRLLYKVLPFRFMEEIKALESVSVPEFQSRLLKFIFPSFIDDSHLSESRVYVGDDSKYKNACARTYLESGVRNPEMEDALFNIVLPDGKVLVGKNTSEVRADYLGTDALIIPSAEDYYGFRGDFGFPIYPAFFATRGILLENLNGLGKFDLMPRTANNFRGFGAEILYLNIPWSSDIVDGKVQVGSISTPLNLIKPKTAAGTDGKRVQLESAEIRIEHISERVLSAISNIEYMKLSDLYLIANKEVLTELYSTYEL